jgi:hypothetical protein
MLNAIPRSRISMMAPHPGADHEVIEIALRQPAKQGMDPASQVHNIDPRDLSGKKQKESDRTD